VQKENEQIEELSSSDVALRFGPYEVDSREGRLSKHGVRIKLSGQPLEVLLLLLDRPGELVTREELRRRLWAGDVFVDFERSLNSAVKKLRRALNDDPQKPRYIDTEPRKGYRFIATIESGENAAPASLTAGSPEGNASHDFYPQLENERPSADNRAVPQAESVEPTLRRHVGAVGIGLALLLAAVSFVVYRANRKTSVLTTASVSKNAKFRSSIAVLGFKNLSSGHDADWLSTAITQMLSTELANGYKVRIIPQETVARAKLDLGVKDKDGYPRETLRALRADLGSDYAVTGSYVALGNRNSGQVRLDLRLQETISGEPLARIAVSGKQSEIFDLVGRAGHQMQIKLGATVPPEGDVDWRTVMPGNPEAARLYSDGLSHLRVFENLAASESLQESVILEPDFALGHSALAEAWSALGYDTRAVVSAQRALSLSSSLPEDERLEIEGRYYELSHDWAGAIGAYRHLWQDFPDDLESGLRLAAAQTSAGNVDEASATLSSLRSLPEAQRDDPRIDLAEASVAQRNGDYKRQQILSEDATRKAQSSGARLLLAQGHLVRAVALKAQSQLQEATHSCLMALDIFQAASDREGAAVALSDLGLILQQQGDSNGARQRLGQALDYFRQVGDTKGFNSALASLREISRSQGQPVDEKLSTLSQ
jgi:DNA-binding winged helix-turn-helix (wHTH) protein/TolB-like protein/tetratricopeptide (TPR) repeat protein